VFGYSSKPFLLKRQASLIDKQSIISMVRNSQYRSLNLLEQRDSFIINDVPHELYGVAHLPQNAPPFGEFAICATIHSRFTGKLKIYYSKN
jgi:N-acetylglutamate synthase-like GNAT family acetyltransferase